MFFFLRNRNIKKYWLGIIFGIISIINITKVHAYIPAYPMIVDDLARSHGQGTYRIKQTVTFIQSGTHSLSLQETWWFGRQNHFRVDVTSLNKEFGNLYLRFIYRNEKKIFKSTLGNIYHQKISPYHLDWPFHMRQSQQLKKLFATWRMTPWEIYPRRNIDPICPSTTETKNQLRFSQKSDCTPGSYSPRALQSSSDFFVQLDRRQGVITYRIALKQTDPSTPKLWIEQDVFVIREWKWIRPIAGQLTAWNYSMYPGFLLFPSLRRFRWSNSEVLMQVQSVQKISHNPKIFHTKKHLSRKNHLPSTISLIIRDKIREFYHKFR